MKDLNLRTLIPLLSVLAVTPACSSSEDDSNLTPDEKIEVVTQGWCESARTCDDEFDDEFDSVEDCISYFDEEFADEDAACKEAYYELWKCHSYHYTCEEYDTKACPTESAKVEDVCYEDDEDYED